MGTTSNLELAIRLTARDQGVARTLAATGREVDALSGRLRQLAAVAASAFGAREILRAAEDYGQLTARIRLATQSQEEFNTAQAGLFGIAQRTRVSLESVVNLYAKTAASLREVGASQGDSLGFIESITQGLAISGSTGQEAASVILQLSQALGTGRLQGEEFRAVFEANRRIMQAFADGMNVPIGKLKEMAEAGQLTTEKLFAALSSQRAKLAQEYAQLPETVTGALQRVQNAFTQYIGQADQQGGGTRALANALTGIAENFGEVADAALLAGGVIASVYAGKALSALVGYGRQLGITVAHEVTAAGAAKALAAQQLISAEAVLINAQRQAALISGLQRLTFAQTTLIPAQRAYDAALAASAASAGRLAAATRGAAAAMAFLGGPIGAVITLLTLGGLAWLAWGDKAESAAQKARRGMEETSEAADRILKRLKDEKSFGAGDLGTLRAEQQALEDRIGVLNQSSGGSPEAAKLLAEKHARLKEITAAIEELEKKETEQAANFDKLAKGQGISAKNLAEAHKDAVKDAAKAYDDLVDRIRDAWQSALSDEKDYLARAADLRAKASRKPMDESAEGQASATLDVIYQTQKLQRIQSEGNNLERIQREAEALRGMAGLLTDQQRASEALRAADLAEAAANEKAAAEAKRNAEDLLRTWNQQAATGRDLSAAMRALENGTTISIKDERAQVVLKGITDQLGRLAKEAGAIQVKGDFTQFNQQLALARAEAAKGVTVPVTAQPSSQNGQGGSTVSVTPTPAVAEALRQAAMARGGRL